MLPENIVTKIARLQGRILPTGSRVICNPAPTNTDEDWVIQVTNLERLQLFRDFLTEDGWEHNVGEQYEGHMDLFSEEGELSGFASFKKGVFEDETTYNILLVGSHAAFRLWTTATGLAKAMNLTKKSERVELFRAILYNEEIYVPPSLTLAHEQVRYNEGSLMFTSTMKLEFKERVNEL